MHRQVSINSLCLAPAPLAAQVEAVARLGACALTPVIDAVLEAGPAAAAAHVRDAGLEVAAITHMSFGFADAATTRAARERLARTIDAAAQIGAQSIVMTTGGRGSLTWPQAAVAFAEAVAPCAEAARAAGMRLGIEGTSHLYADASIAHRLADTTTLARLAGVDVVLDTFACWFDADIDAAIVEAGPYLALVQVSDYAPGDRSLPCRAVPGDGICGLNRLIPAMAATGFGGYYDIEVIGPRLAEQGIDAGLTRAAAFIGALLDGKDQDA